MKINDMKLSAIHPYKKNPRQNESAIEGVKESIKAFGFQQPIVVDKKNTIIVGHTRYYASIDLDLSNVPVVVASKLTPKQVRAYRIADNKTNEFSEWDFDLLKTELKNIDELFTGFTDTEIEDLLNSKDVVNKSSELDASNFSEFDHQCPKCGFEYDD